MPYFKCTFTTKFIKGFSEIKCSSQTMRAFLWQTRVCSLIVCVIFWLRRVETESAVFCVRCTHRFHDFAYSLSFMRNIRRNFALTRPPFAKTTSEACRSQTFSSKRTAFCSCTSTKTEASPTHCWSSCHRMPPGEWSSQWWKTATPAMQDPASYTLDLGLHLLLAAFKLFRYWPWNLRGRSSWP